jgi:hypothetical protein
MNNWDHLEQIHRDRAAAEAAERAALGVLSKAEAASKLAEAASKLAEAASKLAEEIWRDSPQAAIAAMEAAIAAFRQAEEWEDKD